MLSSVWNQLFGKKDDEYEAHPIPKLSTKQQIKIVQELREHATQKARKRKKKVGKVVPINGNHLDKSSGEYRSRSPSHSSNHEISKSPVMKNDEQIRNDSKDERSLKLALTHPTISKFLKDFMIAQGCGDLLDFYLDIVEIRSTHRRFLHKEAYDLWIMLANKYLLETSPCPVVIKDEFKEMICHNLPGHSKRLSRRKSLLDALGTVPQKMTVSVRRNMSVLMGKKQHVLDQKVWEGLQFALYEVFFEIKTGSWIPFSESDVFASLLQRKEVRTTLILNRTAFKTYFDLADVSGNFLALMGNNNGIAQSDRSDDRESDAGSAKSSKKSINSSLGEFMHRAFERGERHRREVQDTKGGRSYMTPPLHDKIHSADSSMHHRDGSVHREEKEMTGDDELLSDQPIGGKSKNKPCTTTTTMDCTSSSSSPSSAGGGGSGNGLSNSRIQRNVTDTTVIGAAESATAAVLVASQRGGGSSTGSSGLYARIGHVLRKSFNGTSNTSSEGMDMMNTSSRPDISAVRMSEQNKGTGLGLGRQDRISSRSAPGEITRIPEQDNESLTGGGLTRRESRNGSIIPGESRKSSQSQLLMTSSAKYSTKRLSDASLPAVVDSPALYDSSKRMTRSFQEGKQDNKKSRKPSHKSFDVNLLATFDDGSKMIYSEPPPPDSVKNVR